MRSFRFPWHREPVVQRTEEPVLSSVNEPAVAAGDTDASLTEGLALDMCEAGMADDPHGSAAVFGLIGASSADGIGASGSDTRHLDAGRQFGDTSDPGPDVIEMLQEQYWRSLDDPQASLAGEWSGPAAGPEPMVVEGPVDRDEVQREPHDGWSATESIEALVGKESSLEELFGPLRKDEMPDLDIEPVPEILRCFAPPEFHAAVAKRAPALPPALTRREHHALTVDSPLPAPMCQQSCELGEGPSATASKKEDHAHERS